LPQAWVNFSGGGAYRKNRKKKRRPLGLETREHPTVKRILGGSVAQHQVVQKTTQKKKNRKTGGLLNQNTVNESWEKKAGNFISRKKSIEGAIKNPCFNL